MRHSVYLLLAWGAVAMTGCDRQASKLATEHGSRWGIPFNQQELYFDSAISLDPENVIAHAQRGIIRAQNGLFQQGVEDLQRAVELDPTGLHAGQTYNNLAWMLATCTNEKYRDGKEAVRMATQACEFTYWEDAGLIDTLAAAYAESGNFEAAMRWQQKAFELSQDPYYRAQFIERLALYRSGKAYRE